MKRFTSCFGTLVGVIMVCLASTGLSRAGLLPVNNTITADENNFRYSYGIVLTSDSTLKTGDFFTVYDFQGLAPGTNAQPAGFTFSTANVGPTPASTLPTDNSALANITWTYTGPTSLLGSSNLGSFVVDSTSGATTSGMFAALTHRQADGVSDSNITAAKVPVPTAPSVPEPASLALAGVGLPFLWLCLRFRAKS